MVAIYVRQSVDKKDSISIESQIDFCRYELKQDETYKIYQDKGFSGGNMDRDSFQYMLKDIRERKINKVICYKIDRISRSLLDFASIIDTFDKYNVTFISSSEKFETDTPIGRAMLSIVMVFAQLERETIQKRIKDNYYARGKRGMMLGGKPPFGYKKVETIIDNKKTSMYIEDKTQSATLKWMYDKYANTSISLSKMAAQLNKDGIAAPAGQDKGWENSKISRILRSPAYVRADYMVYLYYKGKGCTISNDPNEFTSVNGCFLYGKRASNERKFSNVTGHTLSIALHEGLVDSDTWLAVQYKLDINRNVKNTGKGKHSWLTGLLKCGLCKHSMSVKVSNNSYGEEKYLHCSGKYQYKSCPGIERVVLLSEVEDIVYQRLKERFKKMDSIKIKKNDSNNIELEKINSRVSDLDNQIQSIIMQISMGKSNRFVLDEISNLDAEKSILFSKIDQILKECDNEYLSINTLFNNWDNLNIIEKRTIAKYFLKSFYITEDGGYGVWNF